MNTRIFQRFFIKILNIHDHHIIQQSFVNSIILLFFQLFSIILNSIVQHHLQCDIRDVPGRLPSLTPPLTDLINVIHPREEGRGGKEFRHYATNRPDVNSLIVMHPIQHNFWSAVPSGEEQIQVRLSTPGTTQATNTQ